MKKPQIFNLYTIPAPGVATANPAPFTGRKVRRMVLALLMLAVFGFIMAETTRAQQYQVSYLDSLGGTNSRGNSVNNRGWIAGFSRLTGDQNRHATLWRNGTLIDLGTLGGPEKNSSVVWPVKNNRGFIAGISQTDTPEPNGESWSCAPFFSGPLRVGYTCLGFIWKNGEMRELLPLPGGHNSFATGADNQGQVVGWAENGVHDASCTNGQVLQFRPVVWGPDTGQIRELPLVQGDSSGAATAINNRGQVVGISGACDQAVGRRTAKHAVLWDKNKAINIGNLGAELWITPMAINDHSEIAGFGATSADDLDGNFLRGFFWTKKDGMTRIDPLPLAGHVFTQANGLNERGQVVGSSCTIDGDCRAFFWEDGVLKNLNDFTAPEFNGVLTNAQDINERGEITGRAFDPATGTLRAFIAAPVSRGETSKVESPSPSRVTVHLPEAVKQKLRERRGIASLAQ
jgi:probable HAF family extracellular repeat protein